MATSKYDQLTVTLRKQIEEGHFQREDFLPSENELCRQNTLSRITVRRAFLQLEKEGLIQTIPGKGRKMFTEGTDRRAPYKDAYTFKIGVFPAVTTNSDDYYFAGLLNGLTMGSFIHHRVRHFFFLREQVKKFSSDSFLRYLHRERIDGLINIAPAENEHTIMEAVVKEGIPCVIINRPWCEGGMHYVMCDHYKGSYQLTEYLIQLGHKRIGFITMPRSWEYLASRWKGYCDAHKKHGLNVIPEMVVEVKTPKDIKAALPVLKKENHRPTALFIAGGGLVLETMKYLKKENVNIPGEMSVVAFDEYLLPFQAPKLTCVRQPLEKMGETAVESIVKNLQNKDMALTNIVFEPVFIPGESHAVLTEAGFGAKKRVITPGK